MLLTKRKLFIVAITVITVISVVVALLSNKERYFFSGPTVSDSPKFNIKYFDTEKEKILEVGKSFNWRQSNSLPFLLVYANTLIESQLVVPKEINAKYPEVYDFIVGLSSTRSGELETGQSYFKKLQSSKTFAHLGYIGVLDSDSHTENVHALCEDVEIFKNKNKFSNKYVVEVLTDFELECLVAMGQYANALSVIEMYYPNDINDKYKKSLVLINLYNFTGNYNESKKLIDEVKSDYGNTDQLILQEATLHELRDGYSKALQYLKVNSKDGSSVLRQKYAMYLANTNVSNSSEAIKMLIENANVRSFDVESKLILAHFSFDYGYRIQLEEAFKSLSQIKNISEFSSFNLLEAKMALLNKNLKETDRKLMQVEEKNPNSRLYLWFSYQYNKLINEPDLAQISLKKYIELEPKNVNLKSLIKPS